MLLKLELKKIWNPKILLILVVAGLLFGFLFLEFPLKYFPNGPHAKAQYQLMLDWTKEYGTEMDETEYVDALCKLKEQLDVSDDAADGSDMISYAEGSDEYLEQWAGALFEYELRYNEYEYEYYTLKEQERIQYLIDNQKLDGLFPYEIMGNVWEYWRWASVFIVLSVMILLAPAVTKDLLTGVWKLQYTSKQGRKILKIQFAAMLMSAIGIVVLELLILGGLYASLGTWHFWNNPINSFFYGDLYWFDLTFGGYLLFIILLIILFAGGAAGIAFFFSSFSNNYISLMLKIIPAFVLIGVLCNVCISYMFGFNNTLNILTGIKGIEIYAGGLVFFIGAVLSLIAIKLRLT